MYRDLMQYFWWNNIKSELVEYVNKCSIYQNIKVEHQRLVGELRPLEILTWKWDLISMNFIIGLLLFTPIKKSSG